MPLETMLTSALGVIGVLLSMLIGLIVYVFINLKSEVLGVKNDIADLNRNRVKLVHKDECRITSTRVHVRLDEQEDALDCIKQRMVKIETKLGIGEPK